MRKANRPTAAFLLLVMMLAGCSGSLPAPTPTAASTPRPDTPAPTQPVSTQAPAQAPATTQITIDGSSDDWTTYPVIGSDPAGDHAAGSPDLAGARAFNNDLYFYLLIELHESGVTDHYDILLDVDGGDWDYQLSVWPERNDAVFGSFPVSGNMTPAQGVIAAQGDFIEVKMPLALTEGKPVIRLFVQTFLGSDVGDRMQDLQSSIVAEIEGAAIDSPPIAAAGSTETLPASMSEMLILGSVASVESVYHSSIRAQVVRIGPNDEILMLGNGQTIYSVESDGNLTVYADLSAIGERVQSFAFDLQGQLWVTTHPSNLYRIDEQGPHWVARAVNREFAIDSQGNIFAVEGETLQMVTPEGEVSVVAEGFGFSGKISLTKDDKILIIDRAGGQSRLLQIYLDGTWEIIVDGLPGVDWGIGVSAENDVYLLDWSGFYKVDLVQKTTTEIDFYTNIGESGVFDSRGNLYVFHSNNPLYRINLADKTIQAVFHPRGNTFAMAVDLSGRLYVAYGDNVPGGKTVLYEVSEGNTLREIANFPYRKPITMSLAPDGGILLVVQGPSDVTDDSLPPFFQGVTYRFNPDTEEITILFEEVYDDINQDPVTGDYWWFQYNGLGRLDSSGRSSLFPYPPGAWGGRLAFSENGVLYAVLFFRPTFSDANSGLYRVEADGTWVELHFENETFLDLTLDQDGTVYVVGGVSDASVFIPRRSGVLYMLWRWDPEAGLAQLVYDAGGDQFVIQFDKTTNSLYYVHIEGIARFILEPD